MSNDYTIYTVQTSLSEPYIVRIVNGELIRNQNSDLIEFGLTAIHEDFPNLIPENEIWISGRVTVDELGIFLSGCMTRLRALQEGLSSSVAYDRGLKKEATERQKAKKKWEVLDENVEQPIIDWTRYIVIPGDGSEPPVDVYLVDADKVRTTYKTDFLEGGNGAVYPWVPKDQIWIEADLNDYEIPYVVIHEYVERLLMFRRNLDYDKAHEQANIVELVKRKENKLRQADLMALTPEILKELDSLRQENVAKGEKDGPLISTQWIRPKPTLPSGDHNDEVDFGSVRDSARFSDKELDNDPAERARRVDLIRTDIKEKSCANCQWLENGYCFHKEVDLPIEPLGDPSTICCGEWEVPGLERLAGELSGQKALSALNETAGGALVSANPVQPQPPEEDRGQRGGVIMKSKKSLLSDPEGRKRVSGLRKKYKRKPRITDGWVTVRGARCFVEKGIITKGPKGLIGRKSLDLDEKDIPWAEEEDEYRGLRSLPREYTMKDFADGGKCYVQVWDGQKLLHVTEKYLTRNEALGAANKWIVHSGCK